ncbi:TPA: KAP family P-loop NTPase fold protein [Aeromonas veronii]
MAVAPFKWDEAVQWDGPGAIAGSEESLSADRLDRARYAEFLTKYLAAEGKQRNYVLNLNAEWGAGKTWFIKRWYMELKAHYPTVYIDAWQQDFSDDPLLTVISSIIEQLKEEAGSRQLSPYLSTKLASLLKATAPIVTKALFKKISGINIDDVQEVITADDAGKLVESLFQDTRKKTEAVQLLKHEIQQWVEAIIGKKKKQVPAFILIDELDRCRPSYAVEMLETIKHIFDIPGVVFVLATDTEQLQHAIKVIYGAGFDAQNYLGRFFQRKFTLNAISKRDFITTKLENRIPLTSSIKMWPDIMAPNVIINVITAICDYFSMSLRQVEQLVDRFVALMNINSYDDGQIGRLDFIFLVYLFALHEKDYSYYRLISEGRVERRGVGEQHINSFDVALRKRQDKTIQISLSPSLVLGKPINDIWKDGEYNVSLISLLYHSYEMMILHAHHAKYKLNNDSELKNAISLHVSINPLSHVEAALLARPELSQLEHRFEIYRNFVELSVHFD